jgi:hypothetical protein
MRRSLGLFNALLCLVAFGLLLSACTEKEAWRKTELNDGANAYRDFLEEYPDGEYAAEAIKRIEEQDYVKAVDLGNAEAYGTYLDKHPEGSNSDDAKLNHARLLFEEAKLECSAAKMGEYVDEYPEGESNMDARHYKRVYEYAEHIEIHDLVVKKINLQGKDDGPLDGHGIYAKVTNNGDKSLTTCQIRVDWLSEAEVILLQRLWYVATPPLDMYPTAEWMQVPMKPGETRDFDYIFGKSLKPDYWEDNIRLQIHDLRFEGEKEEVSAEVKTAEK